MPLYSDAMDLDLAKPTRFDALQPAAIEAAEAMRREGQRRRAAQRELPIVADLGNPPEWPGMKVPAGARTVARLGTAAGFDVEIVETRQGCVVQGLDRDRKLGFRAWWYHGKTLGATWHSGGRDRYELVIDNRPPGVNALTHTGKAGYRPPGMGRIHLKLVESPRGIALNVTDLERRLKS